MTFVHEKDIRYNGKSWDAKNIRQLKTGGKKSEAEFVEQCKANNTGLSETQAKELYQIANMVKPETQTETTTQTIMFPDEVEKTDKKSGRK